MTTQVLTKRILEVAAALPEGTPLLPSAFLGLGTRAAVDQAFSRLAKRGQLMRARRGVYLAPIESRFGSRAPEPSKVVEAIAQQETVVPSEAAAANTLGLTTQVPMRQVYLTSGKSRRFKLGKQTVELKHAPSWKLLRGAAGTALRAISWAGEKNAHSVANSIKTKMSHSQLNELARVSTHYMPAWVANEIVAMRQHGRGISISI